MKYIFSEEQVIVPENVKVHIRSRVVQIEGPRGNLPNMRFHGFSRDTQKTRWWRTLKELLADLDFTGKLTKDLSHIAVTFSLPEKKTKDGLQTIRIEIHHGSRKNVATLRTVKSIIDNLITGVTKGYKYKMRYVYAHFPINVNIEKNDDDTQTVEIRYGIAKRQDLRC